MADALSAATLGTIPPEQWPSARLPASAAVRIVRADYPVNAFFHAFKAGEEPEVPDASISITAVYRTDMTLWRMALTPAMATLLERLFAGATLGEALESLDQAGDGGEAPSEAETEEAARSVMVWFREWVSGGFFARVELDPAGA
jgi:hypothetical protein